MSAWTRVEERPIPSLWDFGARQGDVLSLLLHLGLEDLAVVLHAHNIGLPAGVHLSARLHGSVDVASGKYVGRHDVVCWKCDSGKGWSKSDEGLDGGDIAGCNLLDARGLSTSRRMSRR